MKRLFLLLLLTSLVACNRGETAKTSGGTSAPAPIGNAARGPQLAAQYGCNVCHIIPGVEGPQGSLGPSLQGLGSRPAISMGAVQNTPANLVQFIQNPAALNPQSSMPPMAIAENDAKDLVAYLLTLK
ncbi:MAG TPA: c-type cytochrome [Thermoanaerobaculia bacterium]